MKTRFAFLAVAFGLLSAHALEVTEVTARQRWPWNNLVDVDFVVVTNGTEASTLFRIGMSGTYDKGTRTVTPASFATPTDVVAGTNRVTWNLGADCPGLRASDLTLTVTASVDSVYMVIDLSGGPAASSYPVCCTNQGPDVEDDTCRTDKLWLRRLSPGSFTMGSPGSETGRGADENQKQVTVTRGFYLGVFEVTQKQWYNVTGQWPSYFTNGLYRETRPVGQVNYNNIRGASSGANWPADSAVDTNSFIGLLRARTGIETLDLPTEAQWEYACRAGTTTALYTGVNITNTTSDANVALLGRYKYNGGWEGGTNFPTRACDTTYGTAKVGSYQPNGWGLYDMYGNVMDWCLDWYEASLPGGFDPKGPAISNLGYRLRRIGNLDSAASGCRSAARWYKHPGDTVSSYGCGLRLANRLP